MITIDSIKAIQGVENKYGLVLFRMALIHLVDVGVRHLTNENVEESLQQIIAKDEEIKANGGFPIMTVGFQSDIVHCAAELAKFNIWDMFLYVKKHIHIDESTV